jgi:hypothetical protein
MQKCIPNKETKIPSNIKNTKQYQKYKTIPKIQNNTKQGRKNTKQGNLFLSRRQPRD